MKNKKDIEVLETKEAINCMNHLAKMLTLHCVRNNTILESIHRGTTPSSKTGDYSDVKVVSPYGEIEWKEVSQISDAQMKVLMKEIVNNVFVFLKMYFKHGNVPVHPILFYYPDNWDNAKETKVTKDFEEIWEKLQKK